MGNSRFFYDNLWMLGTLNYSSQQLGFPASNTRHRWVSRTWRSDGISSEGEYIEIEMASSDLAIWPAVLLIKYNNLSPSAVITLAAYEIGSIVPDWSQNVPLSGAWNSMIYCEIDAPKAYPIWRIVFADYTSGSSSESGFFGASYFEIGNVYLGSYFQPARNFEGGRPRKPQDQSIVKYSEGGQVSTIKREPFEIRDYKFPANDVYEKIAFDAMFENRGLGGALYFCEDIREIGIHNTFFVKINSFDWTHLTGHGTLLESTIHQKEFWDLVLALETLR
jgi:hypothetical protein